MTASGDGTHKRVLIAGAGFTGAVLARALAEGGHQVLVTDPRPHVAGNCHTETDSETGVLVHVYGPHIFHTADEGVWAYINRFGKMMPYVNRVKAVSGGRVYSLPINLHTINQLFEKAMSPDQARAFMATQCRNDIAEPASFEDQALKFVGDRIYQTFFYGYTRKQWGVEPSRLPASILKRLPLRFTYDDNYFNHPFQGMPMHGYTPIVSAILDCPGVEVQLGCRAEEVEGYDHVVYTGPLDAYFGHDLGRMGYRTLRFERFTHPGDFQGNPVINYCDQEVPFTRISEHRHFAPWAQVPELSVCFREYASDCGADDVPYYPLRLLDDKKLLQDYVTRAEALTGVTFAGRLGTYAYIDMDVAIARALETADVLLNAWSGGAEAPVFVHRPI